MLELEDLVGAVDDELQYVSVHRLLVEVVGAEADRLDRILLVAMTGHDDDLRRRREAQHLLERRKPLGHAFGVGRQAEVLEHDGRLVPAQLRQCGIAVLGDEDIEVLETPPQLALQPLVVFHDQKPSTLFGHAALRSAPVPLSRSLRPDLPAADG